ncbi:hypothetical protein KEM55_000559, partial [Ascosphaera atra]
MRNVKFWMYERSNSVFVSSRDIPFGGEITEGFSEESSAEVGRELPASSKQPARAPRRSCVVGAPAPAVAPLRLTSVEAMTI